MIAPLFKFERSIFMTDIVNSLSATIGTVALNNVLSAIVTLIICLIVIRVLMKLVDKLLSRTKLDEQVRKYVHTGIKLVLYVIGALIVVDSLGIPITSLVALLSVGSLGITLAAEDILGNVAGGLVILSSHPFSVGDVIETSGVAGEVTEITLNHTKLSTANGQVVLLPNQELASSQIINYTLLGHRRVTYKVTASYDVPTETVKEACRQAVAATGFIHEDPAPSVYLSNYGESSIEYSIFCWTTPEHYWDVYFGLGENLRETFAKNNVEMTYGHLNVHIVEK